MGSKFLQASWVLFYFILFVTIKARCRLGDWRDWTRGWEQEPSLFNSRCCHRFAVCWWEPPRISATRSPLTQSLWLDWALLLCEPVSALLLLWAQAETFIYSLSTIKPAHPPGHCQGPGDCRVITQWRCLLQWLLQPSFIPWAALSKTLEFSCSMWHQNWHREASPWEGQFPSYVSGKQQAHFYHCCDACIRLLEVGKDNNSHPHALAPHDSFAGIHYSLQIYMKVKNVASYR